jgi:hypothetical protein
MVAILGQGRIPKAPQQEQGQQNPHESSSVRHRFAACPQRAHYYKSARLEKRASPVKKNEKKNEKPLLELLHPRMEIPALSTPTLRRLLMPRSKNSSTLGFALSGTLATSERQGRFKKRFALIGIFCLTLKGRLF